MFGLSVATLEGKTVALKRFKVIFLNHTKKGPFLPTTGKPAKPVDYVIFYLAIYDHKYLLYASFWMVVIVLTDADFEQKFMRPVDWLWSSAVETGCQRLYSQAGCLFRWCFLMLWGAAVFSLGNEDVVTQTCCSWFCFWSQKSKRNCSHNSHQTGNPWVDWDGFHSLSYLSLL